MPGEGDVTRERDTETQAGRRSAAPSRRERSRLARVTVRHLTASDYRVMPWKNGRGSTAEIAREPADAEFDWRVSMARVEEDGEFSIFPGCDRVILVLDGGGMVLRHREPGTEVLLGSLEPWTFSGDWSTSGALRSGPIHDFNVITRRGRAAAQVDVVRLEGAMRVDAPLSLLFCAEGSFAAAGIEVAANETLIADEPVTVASAGSAIVIRVALHRP